MTHKRRIEITIETHSLTIIKGRGGRANFVRCRRCQTPTAIFDAVQAALIFRVSASEIERLFQIDKIHCADDFAVCGNSLADYFKQEIHYVED